MAITICELQFSAKQARQGFSLFGTPQQNVLRVEKPVSSLFLAELILCHHVSDNPQPFDFH
jgi:hypothetical protein